MIDETQNFSHDDINKNKGLALLSYLSLLFLVPMFVNQNSPYIKFHVNQGIVLFILHIVVSVAVAVVRGLLNFFPAFIDGPLSYIVGLVPLVIFALAIVGIINCLQGQARRLPVIGNVEIYK